MTTTAWAFEHRVQVRWNDLDPLGHVNNAIYLTLLEEGRDLWLASMGLERNDYVIARVEISFLAEITGDLRNVTGRFRSATVGTSSIVSDEQLVSEDGTVLAEAKVVSVAWDGDLRRSRPLTEAERAAATLALAPLPANGSVGARPDDR
jgi:acyl-CoA thioester hydrolase